MKGAAGARKTCGDGFEKGQIHDVMGGQKLSLRLGSIRSYPPKQKAYIAGRSYEIQLMGRES